MLTRMSGRRHLLKGYWLYTVVTVLGTLAQARAQYNPFTFPNRKRGLSDEDLDLMMSSINQLNRKPGAAVGATERWNNQKTGSHGVARLARILHHEGMTCHVVEQTVFLDSDPQPRHYELTWCRTGTGEWKILR